MITLLFFARLRDQLGVEKLTFNLTDVSTEATVTTSDLLQHLINNNPAWQPYLLENPVFIAVNQNIIQSPVELHSHDEVAFFPPVTGG